MQQGTLLGTVGDAQGHCEGTQGVGRGTRVDALGAGGRGHLGTHQGPPQGESGGHGGAGGDSGVTDGAAPGDPHGGTRGGGGAPRGHRDVPRAWGTLSGAGGRRVPGAEQGTCGRRGRRWRGTTRPLRCGTAQWHGAAHGAAWRRRGRVAMQRGGTAAVTPWHVQRRGGTAPWHTGTVRRSAAQRGDAVPDGGMRHSAVVHGCSAAAQ